MMSSLSSKYLVRRSRSALFSSSTHRSTLTFAAARFAHTRPAQGRDQTSEDPGVVAGRGNKDQLKSEDTTSDVETKGVENPHQDVGQQQAEGQRSGEKSGKTDGGEGGVGVSKEEKEEKGPHMPV